MPISLDNYSSWASGHRTTEAAINGGTKSLEDASRQVGGLARFFSMQSAKNVRATVMADFTRALSARYGVTLAQHALSDIGLKPASKLEGQTILRVIEQADKLRKDTLDSVLDKDIRLMTGTVSADAIKTYMPSDKAYVRNYMMFRLLAIDALGETPLDADALQDFAARVNSIKQKLASATAPFAPGTVRMPGASMDFPVEAGALIRALDDKLNQASALLAGQPLSPANKQDFRAVWREALLKTITTIRNGTQNPALGTALDTVFDYVGSGAADGLIPISSDNKDDLAKLLIGMVKAQTQSKDDCGLKEGPLAKQIAASYRQVLNERPWPVIDKTFTAVVGGKAAELQSVIVPGQHIGAPGNATGPIGANYDPGVNGYMCHSAQTDHCVNLAVSSLTVKDQAGAPQLAFRGVRHGVHCAWDISDPATRAAANVQRAQEAVIAAFLADPANDQRVQTTTVNGQTVHTINLTMTSVSLLTPDLGRPLKFWSKDSNERLMLGEQKAAWDAVAQTGVTFQHNGRTIHISPRVFTFNFGVNAGAVKYGSVLPHTFGGWGMSDDMNKQAFQNLHDAATAFVMRLPVGDPRRETILDLLDQCEDVMRGHGERSDNHDAYKVAARVAVITHMIGGTPCWNCKSGKDRTGQMDVECKFLAALIARGEKIPAPGAPLTKEQQGLLRAIALEGGNFEMQKLNTGFAGYKTESVSSIPERLGGQKYRDFHAGGSPYVGV